MKTVEDAKAELLTTLPIMLEVAGKATEGGARVMIGILSVEGDGSGQVLARFDAGTFFEDLELILGETK